MFKLFRQKERWEPLSPESCDFGLLKLLDNGGIAIGPMTFMNSTLEGLRVGQYVFDSDGTTLSIQGPEGRAGFRFSSGVWHRLVAMN